MINAAFKAGGERIVELLGENCCSKVMRENSWGNIWELTPCAPEQMLSEVGIEIAAEDGKIVEPPDIDCEATFGADKLRNNRSRCLTLLRSRARSSFAIRLDSCNSTTTSWSARQVSSNLAR